MKKISVIVPIYHGKQYIEPMIQQIEVAAKKVSTEAEVELILSNDAPDDKLEKYTSSFIEIITVNTDINRGIHGARVRGLENATGEYVLFLDQDDRIAEQFFKEQLKCIQGFDASVCAVVRKSSVLMSNLAPCEEVNSQCSTLKGNYITSPGQVLIKKEAIPAFWTEHILQHNGVDDWFLWISFQKEGHKFAYNSKFLYEHVEHGINASLNFMEMKLSLDEVYGLCDREKYLSEEEMTLLKEAVEKTNSFYVSNNSKYGRYLFFVEQWMGLENRGKKIANFLVGKSIKSVAIYGNGYIGKLIAGKLMHDGMKVKYFVDQKAEYFEEEIPPTYRMEKDLPKVDAIIISLLNGEKKVVEEIRQCISFPVWTLREILEELEEQM